MARARSGLAARDDATGTVVHSDAQRRTHCALMLKTAFAMPRLPHLVARPASMAQVFCAAPLSGHAPCHITRYMHELHPSSAQRCDPRCCTVPRCPIRLCASQPTTQTVRPRSRPEKPNLAVRHARHATSRDSRTHCCFPPATPRCPDVRRRPASVSPFDTHHDCAHALVHAHTRAPTCARMLGRARALAISKEWHRQFVSCNRQVHFSLVVSGNFV